MDQNPYKSPQVVAEEKPADTMPPLPQWRMRLGMACYVVGANGHLRGVGILSALGIATRPGFVSHRRCNRVGGEAASAAQTRMAAPNTRSDSRRVNRRLVLLAVLSLVSTQFVRHHFRRQKARSA